VLLAEDNAVNRTVVQRLLEKSGHAVVAVENGRLALTALARGTFDVVLMDVSMPEMDGLEATRTLRARETVHGGHVPVIALTAQAMKGDRETCLEAGMDAYLAKPLEFDELFGAMEGLTTPQWRPTAGGDASPAPAPPVDPVFDREDLLRRVGGDDELAWELMELFRAELPGMIEALTRAVDGGEARGIQRAAHTLKGSLLNIGAKAAATMARSLETQVGGDSPAATIDRVRVLREELSRLDGALAAAAVKPTPVRSSS
jgi:two-component system sensor histidine kinase/response regulator